MNKTSKGKDEKITREYVDETITYSTWDFDDKSVIFFGTDGKEVGRKDLADTIMAGLVKYEEEEIIKQLDYEIPKIEITEELIIGNDFAESKLYYRNKGKLKLLVHKKV